VTHDTATEEEATVLGEPPGQLVMTWSGYAGTKLGIALTKFQISALYALKCGKDAVVIQSSGSGKSVCFQIPSLMQPPGEYIVLVVPTISLGEDHLHSFKMMNVRAIFLNANSFKREYSKAFDLQTLDKDRPSVIIVMPEILFGSDTTKGVVDEIDRERLSLFVIDEAELIHEWGEFRTAYKELANIKTLFACPILLLSAAMKPITVRKMLSCVLRTDAVVIKGNINPENVNINLTPYNPCKESGWLDVAKQIRDLVNGEKAIVYCSCENECDQLHVCLSGLNVKSVSAGHCTSAEKVTIYRNMKDGNIDLLVATPAFGMGVNVPGVLHVIHIGLPANLSLFVRELGSTGRDGSKGSAHLFICEKFDLKRLSYWTKKVSDQERSVCYENFRKVCEFVSAAFVGNCLRTYLHNYFDNITISEPNSNSQDCCTGCVVKKEIPLKNNSLIMKAVLKCISVLNGKGMIYVYEKNIIQWISGTEDHWQWKYFDKRDLKAEATFGFLSSKTKIDAYWIVKGILRQCFSLSLLKITFNDLPGKMQLKVKMWSLTDAGRNMIADESDDPIFLPDPVKVTAIIIK
jgi:ATP-dependent DNA helicase RecQ